jgi:hypothetical protein
MVHVLLSGYAPFDGPTYNAILKAITAGKLDLEAPELDSVSDECLVSEETCLFLILILCASQRLTYGIPLRLLTIDRASFAIV